MHETAENWPLLLLDEREDSEPVDEAGPSHAGPGHWADERDAPGYWDEDAPD